MAWFVIEREWTTVTKWAFEAESLEAAEALYEEQPEMEPGSASVFVVDFDFWESDGADEVREATAEELARLEEMERRREARERLGDLG